MTGILHADTRGGRSEVSASPGTGWGAAAYGVLRACGGAFPVCVPVGCDAGAPLVPIACAGGCMSATLHGQAASVTDERLAARRMPVVEPTNREGLQALAPSGSPGAR